MKYTNNNIFTIKENFTTATDVDQYPFKISNYVSHKRMQYMFNKHDVIDPVNLEQAVIKQALTESILLYNHIVPSFPIRYMYFYDYVAKNIKDMKFLYISNNVAGIEVALYYSMHVNNIDITYLNNLYHNQHHKQHNDNINKLKSTYLQKFDLIDKFNFDNFTKPNVVEKIIGNFNTKYNFIHYSFPKYNKTFRVWEQLLYACILIILKCIDKGGYVLLEMDYYSKNFIKQIVLILSRYFEEIKMSSNEVYMNSSTVSNYLLCKGFKNNVTDTDFKIMMGILEKWNKVEPDGGLHKTFKNQDIRKLYGIDSYNPLDSNIFVTSLFDLDRYYTSDYNKFIDDLYEKLYREQHISNSKNVIELSDKELLDAHNKTLQTNLSSNVQLCEQYEFIIKPKYIYGIEIFKNKILQETYVNPKIEKYNLLDYNECADKKSKNKADTCNDFNVKQYKYDDSYKLYFDYLHKNKNRLNLMKFAIDSRDKDIWAKTTTIINIPKYITKYIQDEYNMTVSRAFIKMYELMANYNIVDVNSNTINSFHTCEMPGNFISAINYYLKLNNPNIKYNWYANSLNPYNAENKKKYGFIINDSYGYHRKYKEKWLWGTDDTGDITRRNNIEFFEKKFAKNLDLFTSDCGLASHDQEEMLEQEKRLAILNYCQVLIALLTLKVGGAAVFKLFIPISEAITVSILLLIASYFDETILIKQASGSPGSSEIYCIALRKNKHLTDDVREYLFKCLANFDPAKSLFPVIPHKFLSQIENIATGFVTKQIEYLHRSFYYNDYQDILKNHMSLIEEAKKIYAKNWIKMTGFDKLDNKYKL